MSKITVLIDIESTDYEKLTKAGFDIPYLCNRAIKETIETDERIKKAEAQKAKSDPENLFKTISAVYTGGGIWLFYGQLNNQEYFLTDDNGCTIVLDESPENLDISLYDKWQEKHFIRWIEGKENQDFLHSMITRLKRRISADNHGGITDIELDNYKKMWDNVWGCWE